MPPLSLNTENIPKTHTFYNTYNNWNVQQLVNHMLFSPETQHIPDDKIASIYLKGDHTLGGKPLTHFDGPESGHVFEALCFAAITSGFSDFGAVRPLKGNINIKHSYKFSLNFLSNKSCRQFLFARIFRCLSYTTNTSARSLPVSSLV